MMYKFSGELPPSRQSDASRKLRDILLAVGSMLALVWVLGWPAAASARIRCDVVNGVAATLPNIKVAATTPVNTVLWRTTGVKLDANCGVTPIRLGAEIAAFYRLPLDLGDGLSLYLTYNNNRGSTLASFSTGVNVKDIWLPPLGRTPVSVTVDLELVKTGVTATTGRYRFNNSYAIASIASPSDRFTNPANFIVMGLENISFTPSTCTILTPSPIRVDLGQVSLNPTAGFGSAIRSTSPSRDFNIAMNCDTTAAGAFKINMQLTGQPVAGYEDQGVLSLSSGAATGMGIQVLRGASSGMQTPVIFNTPWVVASYPLTSGTVTVPFSARYYQTAARVTPGAANGVATFTVTYQ